MSEFSSEHLLDLGAELVLEPLQLGARINELCGRELLAERQAVEAAAQLVGEQAGLALDRLAFVFESA